MNRRRFLQALFAVPCLAAPLLVPLKWEPPKYDFVRVGPGHVPTLAEAFKRVRRGGTVYVMPGHREMVVALDWGSLPSGVAIVGPPHPNRATFTWPALLGEGG